MACGGWRSGPEVVHVKEGQPLYIISGNGTGEDIGPGNVLVNITPLTSREEGADCLDGADNDADGLADCDDPDCASAPECTTTLCANEVLPSVFPFRTEGELTVEGHLNRFLGCAGDKSRERIFAWQSPLTGRIVFDASKSTFAATMSVRRGSCVGPEAGNCPAYDFYDYRSVATSVEVTEGEWLYVMIGAISDTLAFGRYRDRTHYVVDIREWAEEDCDDGIDNDGNGLIDWDDPKCRW